MAFQKGHKKIGGIKKGEKHKETLLREERRAIFDAEVSKRWTETIAVLKPEYIADQFMGKAPDKVEHSGEIGVKKVEDKEKISNAIKGITGKPTGTN